MYKQLSIAILLLFLCKSTVLQADYWPVIEHPSNSVVSWISENMNRNGIPMQILQVEHDISEKQLAKFYMEQWSLIGNAKIIEQKNHIIVTLLNDPFLYTAQIEKNRRFTNDALMDNTIMAYISISKIDRLYTHPAERLQFYLPIDFQVISDVKSKDFGKLSRTIIAKTNRSLSDVHEQLTHILESEQWQPVKNINPALHNNDSTLLIYQKPKRELILSIEGRSSDQTHIVYTDVLMEY